ncbi:hypothetical protein GCM10009835_38230 [Planosporangium flavigriseum]|uniref:Uncharacterized protein n=2 Tax=Planosporangium flavigriseum TaxID=373681 RepID=A0A8J3LIY0_9ACTN|nr:hypothetical protein Pfl04_25120 [Planosporangium flavigriseum]
MHKSALHAAERSIRAAHVQPGHDIGPHEVPVIEVEVRLRAAILDEHPARGESPMGRWMRHDRAGHAAARSHGAAPSGVLAIAAHHNRDAGPVGTGDRVFHPVTFGSTPCSQVDGERGVTPVHGQVRTGWQRRQRSAQQQVRAAVEAQVTEVDPVFHYGR